MRWIAKFHPVGILLAFVVLGVGALPVSAATQVVVRNDGLSSLQIGFDSASPMTVAPRGTARFSLEDGEHTAQCRFEGMYDGCNLEERFTIAGARQLSLNLRPVLTLEHAIALVRQGEMDIKTRRDGVWATNTPDVTGPPDECAAYGTGNLASVSTRVRGDVSLRDPTVAPQNLCGDRRVAIAAVVGGATLYFQPRFLIFRDSAGRPVMVRQ